jgi:hypothetical protein
LPSRSLAAENQIPPSKFTYLRGISALYHAAQQPLLQWLNAAPEVSHQAEAQAKDSTAYLAIPRCPSLALQAGVTNSQPIGRDRVDCEYERCAKI